MTRISDFGLSIQRDYGEDEAITGTLDWKSPKFEIKDSDEPYSTERYDKDSFPQTRLEYEQAGDIWACGLVAMCVLDEDLDPLGLKQCSWLAEKELKKNNAMFMMEVWIEEHLRRADEKIENEVSGGARGKCKKNYYGAEEDHTVQEMVSEDMRPVWLRASFATRLLMLRAGTRIRDLQRVSADRSEWKTVAHRDGCQVADIPLNTLSTLPQQRLKSTVLAELFSYVVVPSAVIIKNETDFLVREVIENAKPDWDLASPLTVCFSLLIK